MCIRCYEKRNVRKSNYFWSILIVSSVGVSGLNEALGILNHDLVFFLTSYWIILGVFKINRPVFCPLKAIDKIQPIWIEAILMPNQEIICNGRSLGFMSDDPTMDGINEAMVISEKGEPYKI